MHFYQFLCSVLSAKYETDDDEILAAKHGNSGCRWLYTDLSLLQIKDDDAEFPTAGDGVTLIAEELQLFLSYVSYSA